MHYDAHWRSITFPHLHQHTQVPQGKGHRSTDYIPWEFRYEVCNYSCIYTLQAKIINFSHILYLYCVSSSVLLNACSWKITFFLIKKIENPPMEWGFLNACRNFTDFCSVNGIDKWILFFVTPLSSLLCNHLQSRNKSRLRTDYWPKTAICANTNTCKWQS